MRTNSPEEEAKSLEAKNLDVRLLNKPSVFRGEGYRRWRWQVLNYIDLTSPSLARAMNLAERRNGPVPEPTIVEESKLVRFLYAFLCSIVDGPPLLVLQHSTLAESRNGLEAWRLLSEEYQSQAAGRKLAMLQQILCRR